MIGVGLSLPELAVRRAGGGLISGLDTDAAATIAAMVPTPDATRQALINSTVLALKTPTNVWVKLTFLYPMAAHSEQAASINWKAPGTFTFTKVGTPVFVVDRGYTGSGTNRLDTGCNLLTSGTPFVQDSCHMGFWGNTEGGVNTGTVLRVNSALFFSPQTTSAVGQLRMNTATTLLPSTASTIAHFIGIRRDAANQIMWRNGVVSTAAAASQAIASANIFILNDNVGATPYLGQVSVVHAGGALSDAEAAALNVAMATYRTGVGLALVREVEEPEAEPPKRRKRLRLKL